MSDSTTAKDNSINQAANKTAQDIEAAVKGNVPTDQEAFSTASLQAYNSAMSEVDQFKSGHTPEQYKQFCAGVTDTLAKDGLLPRVSLFEAKADFAKIDSVNPNAVIEPAEIRSYGNQKDVNELRQTLLNNVADNWKELGAGSSKHKFDGSGMRINGLNQENLDDDLRKSVEKEQNHKLLEHLFVKDTKNQSLYDKLIDPKDPEGNIPPGAIGKMIANAKDMGLTPDDVASLELLQSQMRVLRRAAPGVTGVDDMKKEDLRDLCKANDVDVDKFLSPERSAMQNLFKQIKQQDGTYMSLYDKLKDHWGNIKPGKIREYLDNDAQNPARFNLSPEDRAGLRLLQSHMSHIPWTDDVKKGVVQQLCKDNGLNYDQLVAGK